MRKQARDKHQTHANKIGKTTKHKKPKTNNTQTHHKKNNKNEGTAMPKNRAPQRIRIKQNSTANTTTLAITKKRHKTITPKSKQNRPKTNNK